jgi:hypothetical protein
MADRLNAVDRDEATLAGAKVLAGRETLRPGYGTRGSTSTRGNNDSGLE